MQFFKALSFAALAAVTAAQATLKFTSFPPNTVQSGSGKYSLNYMTPVGKVDTPVTIELRKGKSGDLAVIGQALTTKATGGVFVFTPPSGLASGSDYALSIAQPGSEPNYTPLFTIEGTASSSSSSSASSTASSTSSASSTVAAAPYGAGNSTMGAATGTTMMPVGTGAVGTGGSLVPTMSRNTTFSSATLSPSTTGGSGSGSGSGSSATAASSSVSTGAASRLDSQFALVFGIVGAFAYLN